MYTNMLSNVQNFDVISENIYKIQSWWRHHNLLQRYLLSINDWCIWTHMLSELKNWNIEGAIWNKVQILQDAPTEPSPHTSLLYIPPLWRASRKTSQFQIKTILLANTFHRHWYAQGFAPDQYGPSVLHKRPFCNAFSGCGSGKRFFHSESTGCRKKNSKEKSKWAAGAPSNISNNFRASGGDSKEVGEGFYSENPIWNYLKASIAPFDFYETFCDTL